MYTYYNTYTHCISNVDQKIILKKNCILQVDVCEYRIIFGVCVLLVCLVCWCTVNGMFYFVFLKWYNRPLERCFRSTKFREKGGMIYLEQHPQSSMGVSVMKNKCTNKRTNKRQCFYVFDIETSTGLHAPECLARSPTLGACSCLWSTYCPPFCR